MRLPAALHSWRLTPRQAIALQQELSTRVKCQPLRRAPRWIAGLDAAVSADGRYCLAAVVLWDRQRRRVHEHHTARRQLRFPYIPGLLSFREGPALLAALRRLKHRPDVLMCDGQGLAHPRLFGIACHVGVLCNLPALGCAKSRLTGQHAELDRARGSHAPLTDGPEVIGEVVRTRAGVKPLFVSVGHRLDLVGARELVLACALRFRLPEPTRLADQLVAAAKRGAVAPTTIPCTQLKERKRR
jgi:deoxyribonuclease V